MKKIILLSTVALLFSCGIFEKIVPNETNSDDLTDTHWAMIDESGVINVAEGKRSRPLTIYFPSSEENSYTAFLGCNTIRGHISLRGRGKINFSRAITTEKICRDMTYEKAFINIVNQINRYNVIDNNRLYFYKDKILLMSFKKSDK